MLNFNIHSFSSNIINRCNESRESLLGTTTVNGKQVRNRYRLIKCASDKPSALGIAHVDTVFSDSYSSRYASLKNKKKSLSCPVVLPNGDIRSGALDDRLGVSILLDILPVIMPNFHFDVLLTDDEEIGQSTGEDFTNFIYSKDCPPDLFERVSGYNFLFQFDRAGTDVVTYDYCNDDAEGLLEDAGWHIGLGAFSDICSMFSLGIWGANFGCGYHLQHSNNCYVDMDQLDINLRKFVSFVNRAGDDYFDHICKPRKSNYYDDWTSYRSGDYSLGTKTYSPKSPSYNTYNDDPVIMYAAKEDPFYSQEDRAWAEDWDEYVRNYADDSDDVEVDIDVDFEFEVDHDSVVYGYSNDPFQETDLGKPNDEDLKAIDKVSRSSK
jgi:hypothetical protein